MATATLASTTPHAAAPQRGGAGGARVQWVNVAKGIGIILMVIGHVGRGLKSNHVATPGAYDVADNAIYAFHMPLFFFLSGLFVVRGVQKSARTFLGSKVRTILYPYFLWATLQLLFLAVAAKYANSKASPWEAIARLPWQPYNGTQFWFLYVLMACMVLYWALYQLRLGAVGIALLAGAAYFCGARVHLSSYASGLRWLSEWQVLFGVRTHFLEFALGAALAPALLRSRGTWSTIVLIAAGAGLMAGEAWLATTYLRQRPPGGLAKLAGFATGHGFDADDWLKVMPAAMGIAGTCLVAAALVRWNMARLLEWLGELTLPIFVAHVIVAAGVRVAMVKVAHVHGFGVNLLVGTIAGLAIPVLMVVVARRVGFDYLFAWREGGGSKRAKSAIAAS